MQAKKQDSRQNTLAWYRTEDNAQAWAAVYAKRTDAHHHRASKSKDIAPRTCAALQYAARVISQPRAINHSLRYGNGTDRKAGTGNHPSSARTREAISSIES